MKHSALSFGSAFRKSQRSRCLRAVLACSALLVAGAVFAPPAAAADPHPVAAVVPSLAKPLPLTAVRLTGGPLKHAQDLDAAYLLKLEPDRMLAYFRIQAGLEPKAKGYGGWDGGGKNLTGHIAGHYLSAVSLMYAATGDERFKQRADYIVSELKLVQEKQGDGYLGALEGGKERFAEVAKGDIRSGGFDLNGLWSPWYVLHKVYAGLRDAYHYTGNRDALELEIKFGGWAEKTLSGLSDAQIQKMLGTEFGGMNEIAADLYRDTGDKRWLDLYERFNHKAIVEPLSHKEDILGGKHGNTQVPKLLGTLEYYIYTGREADGTAAKFFWEEVAHHHSFATGGHGQNEYFGQPDKLNNMIDGRTAESCNVYNMLKFTRKLFALQPDVQFAEFQERALFNHILGSIDPKEGWTCYMVPVGRGVNREYEPNMTNGGFTCCVGSGMESHALHGDGLYFESGEKLWVNIFTPSTADWKSQGLKLALETDFPLGDSATVKITSAEAAKALTLAIRRPAWAGEGFAVKVNGEAVSDLPKAPGYVEIKRTWKAGDTIVLTLPKALHTEALPDNPRRVALMWGPLVLAGDLSDDGLRKRNAQQMAPVFVAAEKPITDWLKPVSDKPGTFRTEGVGQPQDVEFVPFYLLHRKTYGAYWDIFTPSEWAQKQAEYAAEQARVQKLKDATVGFAQPGEMQPERDYNFQGEESTTLRIGDHPGRRGAKWFSFDMPVDDTHPMSLVVTYYSSERRPRTFEILVDGKKLKDQKIEKEGATRFYDIEYALPAEAVKGKKKVTIRFQAAAGSEIATVFGVRTVRSDMLK